jgi:hypothetical protein
MVRSAVLLFLAAGLAWGDERTQRLAVRLAEEAAAFGRVAPQVLGVETLQQRAQKPPRRFRIRIGKSATRPAELQWQQRKIVSEYGFSTFAATRGVGGSLHELRQVTSVDGRMVKNQGPEALARIILASDESRKRELLQQFEEHGLIGAVTDFGPSILLFEPANIGRYEFGGGTPSTIDNVPTLTFAYAQIDGPNPLTFFDAQSKQTKLLGIRGEIWVRADTYLPLRITLESAAGDIRQEATVDYQMSRYGALLPVSTRHQEKRAGIVTAENTFVYSEFRRFGASADIIFEPKEPQ